MTNAGRDPHSDRWPVADAATDSAVADGQAAAVAVARQARLVPNVDADHNVERFVVSGAAALLALRIYLQATGYPQVGGEGFHIAHMLWGGLLLTVALLMSVNFLGRRVRAFAVIAGGAGFGIFIDELGKFITSDNNYFFKPAVPLIYAVFVLLYLSADSLLRRYGSRPGVRLAQAADLITDATVRPISVVDWTVARQLLITQRPYHPVEPLLLAALDDIDSDPEMRLGLAARLLTRMNRGYRWLVSRPWMIGLVVGVALLQIGTGTVDLVRDLAARPDLVGRDGLEWSVRSVRMAARVLSSLLVVYGVVRWRRSRLEGFEWMKRGVLVSLLLVQPLTFYVDQVSGAWSLLLNLALLGSLNFAIGRERALSFAGSREAPVEQPAA